MQQGQSNSVDELLPLDAVMPLVRRLFDLRPDFTDVVEISGICLKKIRNKYRAQFACVVDVVDGVAELPANCEQIDAVVGVDARFNSQGWVGGGAGRAWDERIWCPDQITGIPVYRYTGTGGASHVGEQLRNYRFQDGALWLDQTTYRWKDAPSHDQVQVLYSGPIVDERGYPKVTEREALACAYYFNYIDIQRKVFQGLAQPQQLEMAVQLKDQHVNQARVGEGLNDQALERVKKENARSHRYQFGDGYRHLS